MRKAVPVLLASILFGGVGAGEVFEARETRSLLVFPFENRSSRPDLGWISESFAEVLSSRLAAPGRYALERDERNAAAAELNVPPMAPLLLASKFKIAEILGVDWAVIGSFKVEGQRLIARAQLLDMDRMTLAPPFEVSGALDDLIDLETRLAWRLLAAHDPDFTVGREEDFYRRFPEVRLDAFENYIRGILTTDDEGRLRFLREADRLNPADRRAAFALGRFYFDRKDYANSAPWLLKVVEGDRDYLEALFLLGVDGFFLGKDAEAEKAFGKLAEQVPLNEVWNNLGVLRARRGAYAQALSDFETAYKGDPDDFDFCFNLGVCLWYLKRYDESAAHLEQALRADQDDAAAHALLAVVLGKLGDPVGQTRELEWLAEHEGAAADGPPEDTLPQARLKKNYDGRGFHLLSLALSKDLEQRLKGESPAARGQARLDRCKAFLADALLGEAERECGEAVSLLPRDSSARFTLAQVYETQGRHSDAVRELDTSLRLKESVMAHLWLARAYLSLDQPEAARVESLAALRLDPGNSEAARWIELARRRLSSSEKKP